MSETARVRLNRPIESIGYGRPPKKHQFKRGQSGNPRGRPKGRKNELTIWTELLDRKVKVRERGRERWITMLEALLRRFLEDALKGNVKSAGFVLDRCRSAEPNEVSPKQLGAEDQQILEAFSQQLKAQSDRSTP
jgi:hypothetical protein